MILTRNIHVAVAFNNSSSLFIFALWGIRLVDTYDQLEGAFIPRGKGGIVFAHTDVTPPVGPPYWITASGLYPLLPCKLS